MSSIVSPSSTPKLLRKSSTRRNRAVSALPPYQSQDAHEYALHSIRSFLKSRTCYDAFPVSFRIIILDTKLNVKKALECLFLINGAVSAPLWNSEQSCFAGMLTVLDIMHLIQYYHHTATYEAAAADVETLCLESLRDIEKSLGVATPALLRDHPSSTLFDAAIRLLQTHARRLPFLDTDTETGHEVVVSVLTQYRLLKFISINCAKDIEHLNHSLRKLKIGTYVAAKAGEQTADDPYYPIATASLSTPVLDVVDIFSKRSISGVPILDEDGVVLNMWEAVDVLSLVRLGAYQSLDLTVEQAMAQRIDFGGVVICNASDSVATLFRIIKKYRVHRLVVVESDEEERKGGKKGRLLGIITLSDIIRYLMGENNINESRITKEEIVPPTQPDNPPQTTS